MSRHEIINQQRKHL